MNRQGPRGIDWCHWTWNPVTGCRNRCWYCYAKPLAGRFDAIHGGLPWETPVFHEARLSREELAQPKDGQRVFVCSMGDIFSAGVNRSWVQLIIDAIRTRPDVSFLFLTKRPEWFQRYLWPPNAWLGTTLDAMKTQEDRAKRLKWIQSYNVKWINAAPALSGPHEDLWNWWEPDWLVSEPLHGHGLERLIESEQHVHAWHQWAARHNVPCWVKGMKHWTVRCPIPHELPRFTTG